MSLFQNSVITKQLQSQDRSKLMLQWNIFKNHFHNTQIQDNIRNSKEEQYQGEFLIDLFVYVLGYVKNPTPNFTLTSEYKNVKDSKKADGAILISNKVKAVIELKGTNTTDLGKIEVQAFGYKNNQPECVYVITSNFEKLRFYIDNATEFLEFNLFLLTEKEFELLYLCLSYDSIANDIPKKLKEQSLSKEKDITKALYSDYSEFKRELHRDLVKQNPQFEALGLFKKSQKLLDRFLFLFFAEDRQLLPPNSVRLILNDWRDLQERDENVPLYNRFKKYFEYLNTGFKGKRYDVFAYNGGLFKPDEVLDIIRIDDELLYKHTLKLSEYDFESEIDVNILGHIFENSLNELDEIKARLEGTVIDKATTKRKKDGVFYTPKYITKYIVDNTIGKLCTDKKAEFKIIEEEYFTDKKRNILTKKPLLNKLINYRNWLLNIKICDPACGSGAFLSQALDFLIAEHRYIDELQAKLLGEALVLSDIEKSILENNLFGVDLNEESVEIAKLSLWLQTARPNRKLNDLNNNIKCGNSLIDDVAIAGEKAFNWKMAFPAIFDNGGFDVIIGNPPYGAFIDKISKNYYQKKFNTFQGNFEIYFFFIELISSIIKPKGKIGFITPDTWINIPQAKKLREHILELYGLNNIVIFKNSVFEDASLNAIVFILTLEGQNEECEIVNFDSKVDNLSNVSNITKVGFIKNWKNSEDKQFQVLQNEADILIINKINSKSQVASKFIDVCQGIVPYSTEYLTKEEVKNRVYHYNQPLDENYGVWIQGRAIKRYTLNVSNNEYLNYGAWLHRARKFKYFFEDRILIQEITGGKPPRISAINYSGKLFHDPGIISCINISCLNTKYLLTLINSKLLSWFNIMNSPKGNRLTFPKILIGDIRKLPIIEITVEQQAPFLEKADLMLSLNIDLQEHSQMFQRILQRNFDLEILPRRLQDWYFLSYADFIKELEKQKVKLSLDQEVKWERFFTAEVKKVLSLKAEIDSTDKKIDALVYKLYDLTADEIHIVENC
ncbi:Eco57I restriction-modification methylase domain-containing protein [Arcticibacter eurypsychrophilus]|uniref:Eco57I restriction-modification methylase domain-containing protein n=1 Tax=Arcticibacter eurypsychrophilus TaxID=1434752 RepID=UPI00084CF631|nr:N-6 DNA methylase [Arcticibacter eurypsychrophilus]